MSTYDNSSSYYRTPFGYVRRTANSHEQAIGGERTRHTVEMLKLKEGTELYKEQLKQQMNKELLDKADERERKRRGLPSGHPFGFRGAEDEPKPEAKPDTPPTERKEQYVSAQTEEKPRVQGGGIVGLVTGLFSGAATMLASFLTMISDMFSKILPGEKPKEGDKVAAAAAPKPEEKKAEAKTGHEKLGQFSPPMTPGKGTGRLEQNGGVEIV